MSKANPNVIILTSGISGSSVLTGLISRAGYWTGDTTHKKEYDTYENQELIDLDLLVLKHAEYTQNYTMDFSAEAIARVKKLGGTVDESPFREFLKRCDSRRPWVWKDPRLWLTIYFWQRLIPQDCKFILLTRKFSHAWVSSILRRHIRSYGSLKRYEHSIKDSLITFLDGTKKRYLRLTYEELIVRPEKVIRELNDYLGTALTVEDLKAIYHQPLYKTPRSSPIDYAKAVLIYLKNYSERYDLIEAARR
jgi:hypothetical protein